VFRLKYLLSETDILLPKVKASIKPAKILESFVDFFILTSKKKFL